MIRSDDLAKFETFSCNEMRRRGRLILNPSPVAGGENTVTNIFIKKIEVAHREIPTTCRAAIVHTHPTQLYSSL